MVFCLSRVASLDQFISITTLWSTWLHLLLEVAKIAITKLLNTKWKNSKATNKDINVIRLKSYCLIFL